MSKFLYRELKSLMLGELIGEGMSRKVYACKHDPDYVVKVEDRARMFQNVAEWEAWTWVRGTKKEKWLAPCLDISACGSILLQRRAGPLRPQARPKTVPAFLTDVKRENFGYLDGHLVCFDYGTILSGFRDLSAKPKKTNFK